MIPPPPHSGRAAPALPPEGRRALLRHAHALDTRDPFATDPDDAVRALGLLALRRTDVNDSFALGDLCARLALDDGDRLRVVYVGKTLIAYRSASERAANDVDRALAARARDRFVEWVIEAARLAPTHRNLAVALWAIADDEGSTAAAASVSGSSSGISPRRAPPDLLHSLLALNGISVSGAASTASVSDADTTHTTRGDLTEFAGVAREVPQSEFEAEFEGARPIDSAGTQADAPTRLLDAAILASPGASPDNLSRRGVYADPIGEDGEFKPGERILDRYEVADVKFGGMGVVYLCYDHEAREPVALKSFQSRYLDNPRAVARFEQEALTWIQLDRHRHVVTAKLVQTITGRPFILLEHISGPEGLGADLRGWIDHHRIDPARAILFALHIALGMQHVHQAGGRALVHRDLKPANILVTQDGIAKVTDFGLVRSLDRDDRRYDALPFSGADTLDALGADEARLTRHGFQVGTSMYMSPEQWEAREVDLRADVYAYGLILYEMLTGRHPYADANARERGEWQQAHLTREITFSASEMASVDRSLRALILVCTAKKREGRPSSWDGIIQTLSQVYQTMTGSAPEIEISAPEMRIRDRMDKGYSLTELGRLDEANALYDEVIADQPDLAWAWARKGRTLRQMERFDEAIACYDRALILLPRYAWAWRGKGMVLEKQDHKAEALACYQEAARLDPFDIWNWYNQADMFNDLGQVDQAVAVLETALNLDPSHASSWAKIGQLHRQTRDLSNARRAFEEAIRLNPRLAWAHNGYGHVLKALGAPREALMAFKRAARHQPGEVIYWNNLTETLIELDEHAEALSAAQQAVRIAAADSSAWAKLGQVLRYLEQYDEALDAYERAIALQPDFAWAINGMGIVLEQLKQYDAALDAYRRASMLTGASASSLYNVGNALGLLARYDEALTVLHEAVALQPDYPRAWARIGSIERARGAHESALEAYTRAIQIDPGYAWAWHELGITYEALDRPGEALEAYRRAAASAPDDPGYLTPQADLLADGSDHAGALALLERAITLDGRSARLWTKMGVTLRALKRFSESLVAFGRAIGSDSRAAWAWSGQAGTLAMLGRHEEALDSTRHALEIAPEEALFMVQQGEALMALNLPRAAADVFERALRLAPDRADTWAKLGQALRRLDKPDMALAATDRALALNGEYAWAWHQRGLALEALDRCEEAEACYIKSLAIDDGVVWVHASRIDVLLKMKHDADALIASDVLIARLPDQAVAWSRRGQVFRHLKRYSAAVEIYDRALAIDDSDAWTWNGRGLALRALNRWDEGLESFQYALARDAGAIWYYHNCGEAWLMLDSPEKAIAVLEAGLAVDPTHDPTRRLLAQARGRLE